MTTIEDARRRLVLKAARRYAEDVKDTRYRGLVPDTRLAAFAEVAADVLGVTMTPAGFEIALKEALRAHPVPYPTHSTRTQAELLRSEWADRFIEAFNQSVGIDPFSRKV